MALTDEQLSKLEPAQLLTLIVEESGEMIQMLGKLARYGSINKGNDGKVYNNVLLLVKEYEQVQSAMTFFIHHHGVTLPDLLNQAWDDRNPIDDKTSPIPN